VNGPYTFYYGFRGGSAYSSDSVDFLKIAKACSYKASYHTKTATGLTKIMKHLRLKTGPILIVVKVSAISRENLGRPTSGPKENKNNFINFIKTNGS